jgi:RimJ/RimL family protein N-acetyltransferase
MVPSTLCRVEGVNLDLRLITPDDAAYVHALRTDPTYNRHLSEVRGSVEDQRRWIESYKTREREGREFYYVIERKDGVRCGLVRLYDIRSTTFTWGSWILDASKPVSAALESFILSFGVGFDTLGRELAIVDVRIENKIAIQFYRRFGMTEIDRTVQDIYFIYPRARYESDRADFLGILFKGVEA